MPWKIYILLLIILIFLIPIPIKIKLLCENNKFYLYIYKFKIDLYKQIKEKPQTEKEKKSFLKTNLLKKKSFSLEDFKILVFNFNRNRFKPTLRINIKLDYGLWDAAATGISYGIISSFTAVIYNLLSSLFKVKKYDFNLEPEFQRLTIAAWIDSIIFVSLVKIIYMAVIIIKSLKLNQTSKAYNSNTAK